MNTTLSIVTYKGYTNVFLNGNSLTNNYTTEMFSDWFNTGADSIDIIFNGKRIKFRKETN